LRIAIVTHCLRHNDGQGRVNYEIAKAAAAAGHAVTLVAADVAPDLLATPGVHWAPISYGPLPSALLRYQVFAVRSWLWLRKHRHEIDVLHVNGAITWGQSDVDSVHFVHSGWRKSPYYSPGSGVRGLYHRIYTRINAYLEKISFERSARIIAVSQKVAYEVAQLGISKSKISVIHNGVDIDEFSPGDANRGAFGLPSGVTLAMFAGDISNFRKNLDSVLEALVRAPHIHLAVAGSTAKSPFPAMAELLGVSSRVHFLGRRRDLPALMKAADIFIFPSRYEPFGLVLLEAMSSGLPVITAKSAGGAELIDETAGVVIENPNDVDAIVAALVSISATKKIQREMGANARRIALEHTWSKLGLQYVELYEGARRGI